MIVVGSVFWPVDDETKSVAVGAGAQRAVAGVAPAGLGPQFVVC